MHPLHISLAVVAVTTSSSFFSFHVDRYLENTSGMTVMPWSITNGQETSKQQLQHLKHLPVLLHVTPALHTEGIFIFITLHSSPHPSSTDISNTSDWISTSVQLSNECFVHILFRQRVFVLLIGRRCRNWCAAACLSKVDVVYFHRGHVVLWLQTICSSTLSRKRPVPEKNNFAYTHNLSNLWRILAYNYYN